MAWAFACGFVDLIRGWERDRGQSYTNKKESIRQQSLEMCCFHRELIKSRAVQRMIAQRSDVEVGSYVETRNAVCFGGDVVFAGDRFDGMSDRD